MIDKYIICLVLSFFCRVTQTNVMYLANQCDVYRANIKLIMYHLLLCITCYYVSLVIMYHVLLCITCYYVSRVIMYHMHHFPENLRIIAMHKVPAHATRIKSNARDK